MEQVADPTAEKEKGRIKLPLNCEAEYFPNFLTQSESSEIFDYLCQNYDFSGRTVTTSDGNSYKRDVGKYIFADPELTDFDHLIEVLGPRAAWPSPLEMVKERLESLLSRRFNVCLCIYYDHGEVSAPYHVDMPEFGPTSFITVISLGAEREFGFRRQGDHSDEYRLAIEEGSLLTMGEHCQERYEHCVFPDPGSRNPRISLSYRPYGWD